MFPVSKHLMSVLNYTLSEFLTSIFQFHGLLNMLLGTVKEEISARVKLSVFYLRLIIKFKQDGISAIFHIHHV